MVVPMIVPMVVSMATCFRLFSIKVLGQVNLAINDFLQTLLDRIEYQIITLEWSAENKSLA
jgi:hypothetical protein